MDQNIILNKPTSSGDSYYIVESNSSDKCIIPIDCDPPLNVVHKNMQGDNGKNTNNAYPKNITVIQDTSTNTSNRVTVTQDASTSASNRVDKGTDSYLELILKSLRDHIVSLENQLRDKQYIIEELLKKSYQSSCNCTVANSNLINAQKYHTKYTENPMISSSNVNDSVNFVKDNIKNSIDLNSESSTKDFTITPSSSHKNSNTDISLNIKSNTSREKFQKIKILVMAL